MYNSEAAFLTTIGVGSAAAAGIGPALLPHFPGDDSDLLLRAPTPIRELTTGLWLPTHPDLQRSARVNAFIEHFSEALRVH